MTDGAWVRLRFVYSAHQHTLVADIPTSCDTLLLAKDGVYVETTRAVPQLFFAPGNRVDVAESGRFKADTLKAVS